MPLLAKRREHAFAPLPAGLAEDTRVWVVRQTREVFTEYAYVRATAAGAR